MSRYWGEDARYVPRHASPTFGDWERGRDKPEKTIRQRVAAWWKNATRDRVTPLLGDYDGDPGDAAGPLRYELTPIPAPPARDGFRAPAWVAARPLVRIPVTGESRYTDICDTIPDALDYVRRAMRAEWVPGIGLIGGQL